ncbi:MAG: hypothetical protein LBH16_01975 [Treponema sp.]|nr:hypothetical protein [Treponema sp.]
MAAATPVYIDLLMEDIKSLPESYTVQVFDFVGYLKSKAASQEGNASSEDCPICAKLRDPVTGEPLYNAETKAAIKEVDDMIAGRIPDTLKRFKSLEEMLVDLDSED